MINEEGEKSFLLLDVRDPDGFTQCHLQGALHYPAPMLSRSVNPYLPEMYNYVSFCILISLIILKKNKEGKLIIIYDLDEKIAVPTGNLFFEKGFDNVQVLTGGLREFAEQYPELVEGEIPLSPKKKNKKSLSSTGLGTSSYKEPSSPSSVRSGSSRVFSNPSVKSWR